MSTFFGLIALWIVLSILYRLANRANANGQSESDLAGPETDPAEAYRKMLNTMADASKIPDLSNPTEIGTQLTAPRM